MQQLLPKNRIQLLIFLMTVATQMMLDGIKGIKLLNGGGKQLKAEQALGKEASGKTGLNLRQVLLGKQRISEEPPICFPILLASWCLRQ